MAPVSPLEKLANGENVGQKPLPSGYVCSSVNESVVLASPFQPPPPTASTATTGPGRRSKEQDHVSLTILKSEQQLQALAPLSRSEGSGGAPVPLAKNPSSASIDASFASLNKINSTRGKGLEAKKMDVLRDAAGIHGELSPNEQPATYGVSACALDNTGPWYKQKARCMRRRVTALSIVARVRPSIVILPSIFMSIVVAVSLWAIITSSAKERHRREEAAYNQAEDKAAHIELQLRSAMAPLEVLADMIMRDSQFSAVNATFERMSPQLLKITAANLFEAVDVQLAPFGHVMNIAPHTHHHSMELHHMNFFEDAIHKKLITKAILYGNSSLWGPHPQPHDFTACIIHHPIFIAGVDANETFGVDDHHHVMNYERHNCTLCYDPRTRTKLWGFISVLVHWDVLITELLTEFKGQGYHFSLSRPDEDNPAERVFLAGTHEVRHLPSVDIPLSNTVWRLDVQDFRGWEPDWKTPTMIIVVIVSFFFTVVLIFALYSRTQQNLLLHEVLDAHKRQAETTRFLQEEKQRTDALLARQYNLIACLEMGSSSNRKSSEYQRGLTMEKINDMRVQLLGGNNSKSNQSVCLTQLAQDSIQVKEVLGEGAFGKVYKGLWRGTVVAVKTIILPAFMSGKEKREKMAVMEAAISSSLAHPNIVTTYTYDIKPIRDSTAEVRTPGLENLVTGGNKATQSSDASSDAAVTSYEVRLVLEFCDKGCMRDALDSGIFFGPSGLNYRAILDTAADVAKAMLHLHLNNVLHGDLKATNVMLKSAGSEGRGVTAKVADFGLSIKMDTAATHVSQSFQGTLTHMAPEVMLHGQLGKPADVYAFGITLWELFTSGYPYKGTPGALIGHQISKEGKRPSFPLATPSGYRELAEACWSADVAQRPSFEDILAKLTALREDMAGATERIADVVANPFARAAEAAAKANAAGGAQKTAASRLLGGTRTHSQAAVNLRRLAAKHKMYGQGSSSAGGGTLAGMGGIIIGSTAGGGGNGDLHRGGGGGGGGGGNASMTLGLSGIFIGNDVPSGFSTASQAGGSGGGSPLAGGGGGGGGAALALSGGGLTAAGVGQGGVLGQVAAAEGDDVYGGPAIVDVNASLVAGVALSPIVETHKEEEEHMEGEAQGI